MSASAFISELREASPKDAKRVLTTLEHRKDELNAQRRAQKVPEVTDACINCNSCTKGSFHDCFPSHIPLQGFCGPLRPKRFLTNSLGGAFSKPQRLPTKFLRETRLFQKCPQSFCSICLCCSS